MSFTENFLSYSEDTVHSAHITSNFSEKFLVIPRRKYIASYITTM